MFDVPTSLNADLDGKAITYDRKLHAEIDFGESMLRFDEDLSYQEAKTLIDDLEPDQQVRLVALMYLGRGDFTIEEWDEALAEANDGWTTHTGEYLLARPRAGDYLAEGLELFNHA